MSVLLKLNFVFVVIFCLIEVRDAQSLGYCDPQLCEGKVHIACNNTGAFASRCGADAKVIPITTQLRMDILHKHNTFRNRVANGSLEGFEPAVRMATMTWDKGLAKLAVLNVKQCKMKHDSCRKTWVYRKSGQNLASSRGSGLTTNVHDIVMGNIQMWFDEYKNVNMKVINSFQDIGNIWAYGHFTALVQEKNCRVGCGILRETKNGIPSQFLACNYAYNSVYDMAVYRAGPTASKCTTGTNKNYPGLCSTAEKYNLIGGSY